METRCCVCGRKKITRRIWIRTTDEKKLVSHGYCPMCMEKAMREVMNLKRKFPDS